MQCWGDDRVGQPIRCTAEYICTVRAYDEVGNAAMRVEVVNALKGTE